MSGTPSGNPGGAPGGAPGANPSNPSNQTTHLYQSLVKDDLAMWFNKDTDVSFLSNLCYWPMPNDMSALAAALGGNSGSDAASALVVDSTTPTNDYLTTIVTDAILESQLNSVSTILTAVRDAGMRVFYAQLANILGTATESATQGSTQGSTYRRFTSAMDAYIKSKFDSVVDKLVNSMPIRNVRDCSQGLRTEACQNPAIASNLVSFNVAAATMATKELSEITKDEEELRSWLFTHEVIRAFMIIGVGPWLILQYIASYVPGEWNKTGNRSDASFYDARYAEYLIYNTATRILDELKIVNAANTSKLEIISNKASVLKNQITTNASISETDMRQMYRQVSELSNQSRSGSELLEAKNKRLEQRRSYALSLLNNNSGDDSIMRRQRKAFYAWLAAYAVVVASSIFLIVNERHATFMLLAGVVLASVSLYAFGLFMRTTVRVNGISHRPY
jgi:hypothetical protein